MFNNTHTFDLTLGIKYHSWMILHALNIAANVDWFKKNIFSLETFAFYNGREMSIGIDASFYKNDVGGRTNIILFFGEHRNSDALFVQHWVGKRYGVNPPTIKDFPEESYNTRKFFHHNQYVEAADYILNLIKEIYESYTDQ